jgi:RNA polymerase sigma-70 factor (ECF subfamily)
MTTETASDERCTPLRERQLIEGARKGCSKSAHALVNYHQDRLHAFVWRMVRHRQEAEEICQEAFLRAFAALESFDFSYRFSTWLFTIGYRLCLNVIRKKRDVTSDIDFNALSPTDCGHVQENVGDSVANSDEARRLREKIWDSVDQLTPQQRATVLLFYKESLSCQDIGDILEMPAATVKSHLHRARSRLKELLGSHVGQDWSQVRFGEVAE